MKTLIFSLSSVLFIVSCNKEKDTGNNDNHFTPQPESKTISAIFISSFERDLPPYGTKYLTVFEPNGSVRWKKPDRGSSQDGYMTYGNGMIYSSEPGMSSQNFYAYDINNGNEVWSITNSTEWKYYPVVRNDTLFCSTKSSSSSFGNITAFNARTGALIWRKQVNYPYWPLYLTLDGNTLFFIVTLSGTDSKVISFNINTRTVNWESASLGINLASAFSKIAVSGSVVAIKTGTKYLMAFDRATGASVWTKPGIPFEQPVIHKNTVFTFCWRDTYYPPSNDSLLGLYAFDLNTGNQLWKWKKRIEFANTNPFVSGNLIFHAGMLKDSLSAPEKGYLKAFDIETGNEIWAVTTGIQYNEIPHHTACVGNQVCTFKYPSGLAGSQGKIVTYDFSTGQEKESINIPGESFGKMYLVASDGKAYSPW